MVIMKELGILNPIRMTFKVYNVCVLD